jgi:hypothetical protein
MASRCFTRRRSMSSCCVRSGEGRLDRLLEAAALFCDEHPFEVLSLADLGSL